MPNKGNLRKWVTALRSGEYAQGINRLFNPPEPEHDKPKPTYCCLGVACHVMEKEGHQFVCNWRIAALLPLEAMDWLGIQEENPVIRGSWTDEYAVDTAAHFNDDERWTFAQIADQIETHFELNEVDDALDAADQEPEIEVRVSPIV